MISYVGVISEIRGIFQILKAIEGTNITLHLAGETCPKSLITTLETYPGWKNVVYFGKVSRAEVSTILSNSRAGICTFLPTDSHIHAVPNKIFEYMNAGLPVVVSDFSYWRELLKDIDNASFVDPMSPESIREAIEPLLKDNEKAKSMSERGLKAVKEKFNWDNEFRKFIIFIKTIEASKIKLRN